MATLYFDTEIRKYCELNWSRAIVISGANVCDAESDDPIVSRAEVHIWDLILSFLGDQAINMRKVSSFFVHPGFRQTYEDSPICLYSETAKTNFGRFINHLPPAQNIKTNVSVYLQPSEYNNWGSAFYPSEWLAIQHLMPKLKNLSTLILEGDYEYIGWPDGGFPHHVVSRIVTFEEVPNWGVITLFKALESLRCKLKREGNLAGLPRKGELASLRSFDLVAYVDSVPLSLDGVSAILNVMPNLARLQIVLEPSRQTADSLSLEPLALKHLQSLRLYWLMDMTSLDWMHLLLAAPNIRELRLARCSSPAGGFQTLNVADLPFLEKAEFRYIPMTALALKAFFAAAPQLKKMKFESGGSIYTPFERCEFQEELYPSMREIAIYFDGTQKEAIDSFLPFIERMPNLQAIDLKQCAVSKMKLDDGLLQAYTHLKSFKLVQSAFTGSYLGSLFNAATSLKSVFWDDSVCDSPFEYLNEQALCQLSTLDFRSVKLEPSILDAFLQRTPHLQHLILLKVFLLITEEKPSLMLAPGSLPELVEFTREWDTFTALSADDCLSIIKAAPHLQKLVLPYYFLKHFSDLPDGFLSELKVFYGNKNTCSKPGQEKKYRKLLRIAPNVATKG